MRQSGIVKWFNDPKGFGFITADEGAEVFVRGESVRAGSAIREGQRVSFEVKQGGRGPEALDVVRE